MYLPPHNPKLLSLTLSVIYIYTIEQYIRIKSPKDSSEMTSWYLLSLDTSHTRELNVDESVEL